MVNGDGTYTYTPAANYSGSDSFTVKAADGKGGEAESTVTITVTPVNDAPVASNDAKTTAEDTPVSGQMAATDADGDGLTYTKGNDPTHGTLVVNGDGSYTYTPATGYVGTDTFTIVVSDGQGGTKEVTVTVEISDVSSKPLIAQNDIYDVDEDNTLRGTTVLANDSDADGGTLIVSTTPVANVLHGTLVLNSDGTFTYTPEANYHGTDNFTYQVCNSETPQQCATAVVTITVKSVNDLPVAVNDSYLVDEKAILNGNVATNDQLSGDGGNVYSVTIQPLHGVVVMNGDGTFTYTQSGAFFASDSFTYRLTDVDGDYAEAIVTVAITQLNTNVNPPSAQNDEAKTKGDTPVTIAILSNDSDSDGAILPSTLAIVNQPTNGIVVMNSDGTVTYTANKGFVGGDEFTYRICDNGTPQLCANAKVKITVDGLDVVVPSGFTPNGDGVNDSFVIKGLETYPNNELKVFNRWGNLVYSKKGYDNSWNGNNGGKGLYIGKELPDGTYYFIIDLRDGSKPKTGYVIIKR